MLVAENEKLERCPTSAAPSINKSPRSLQTNRLPIKVVIPINCDATPLQPGERGGGGTSRRDGREREEPHYLVDVPFLTSQMLHLKASAVFLKVHTLQSQ